MSITRAISKPPREDISSPGMLLACNDRSVWLATLEDYAVAIEKVSLRRGGKDLIELDRWYNHEARVIITGRQPWSMSSSDLRQIMRWKITRGKFRPLMKLIESNSDDLVRDVSSQSFEALRKKEYSAAIQILTALKGVGVATASAILSLLEPHEFPFMSDEALLTVLPTVKKDYSLKAYNLLTSRLKSKAEALGGSLTADDVGRAIWINAMILSESRSRSDIKDKSPELVPPTKRRRL